MSHEHGEFNPSQQKWFCGYWMSQEEWLNIHDYAPGVEKHSEEEKLEE